MKQEEDAPLAYNYRFGGGKFNSYFFQTDNNIIYEVKFNEVMLSDLEGQLYFTTMIIRRDNPNRKQIATNFIEVMADHNK